MKSKKPLPQSLIQADDDTLPDAPRGSRNTVVGTRGTKSEVQNTRRNTRLTHQYSSTQHPYRAQDTPDSQFYKAHSYRSPTYNHIGDRTTTSSNPPDTHTDLKTKTLNPHKVVGSDLDMPNSQHTS